MTKDHQTFYVGINVFLIRSGKLLLGKRKGAYGEGSWGLPGGHLEHRESMTDNATRELLEETGIKAERFNFTNIVNDRHHKNQHYVQIGFTAVDAVGEPEVREPNRCSEWKWFALDSLPKDIFIGHKDLIRNFQESVLYGDQK